MIAFLRGTLVEAGAGTAVVETGGVGYELSLASATLRRLPPSGSPVELFVAESTALYGGGTTLYGFLTREEREIFSSLRDHVPATGAKKALELLDKASRSLPDFRRAVLEGDSRILCGVFGFTRKTAERLVASLKDKLAPAPGSRAAGAPPAAPQTAELGRALDALLALGYKQAEARTALEVAAAEGGGDASVETLVRRALRAAGGGRAHV